MFWPPFCYAPGFRRLPHAKVTGLETVQIRFRLGARQDREHRSRLSYHGDMAAHWNPPTRDGRSEGIDPISGLAWVLETPETHWAEHDARQVTYWRSRPASERLAQAAAYRVRVHGLVAAPSQWTWQLVPAGRVD